MSTWQPGQPVSARMLNRHSAVGSVRDIGGAPGSMSSFGSATASDVRDMTGIGFWIRVFDGLEVESEVSAATKAWQYSWEAVWWDDYGKRWRRHENNYGHRTTDPATPVKAGEQLQETAEAALDPETEVQNLNIHFAARDPVTRRLMVYPSAGGGNLNIKSGETMLMILGTYEQYKDCPDAPGPPPTIKDACGVDTEVPCVTPYPFAAYQLCGNVWVKFGDSRTFDIWTYEVNGGSTTSYRRFHLPRWGGDKDLSTGLPDPLSDCIGVRFLPASAGALTCGCPTCLSAPPEGTCLVVKFRTLPRPVDPDECVGTVSAMDAADAWDKDYSIELTLTGCNATGISSDGVFTFEWQFQDGSSIECDWGPAIFDPCDPCAHWARLFATINVDGGAEPNCGGGHWRGEFLLKDICSLICDCETGPVSPVLATMCGGCGNNQTPPDVWYAIDSTTVKIECCPTPP